MSLQPVILEIENQLKRLKADPDSSPYSGLSVRVIADEEAGEQINIFDDYADATIIDPSGLLAQLKVLQPIDCEEAADASPFEPIWEAISKEARN